MKVTLLSTFIFIFFSCNSIKGEEFVINGTIKNTKSKFIFLEKLSHSSIFLVDSVKINDKGNFIFKANIDQIGFYRITLSKNASQSPTWLLSLSPNEKLTATLDALKPNEYIFKGDPKQSDFQTMLQTVNTQQADLMQLSNQYQNITKDNPNSKDASALMQMIQSKSDQFNTYIGNVLLNSINPITKYYLYSIILQQMQGQQLPNEILQQITNFSKEIDSTLPKSIYASDFAKIASNLAKSNQNNGEPEDMLSIGKPAPDVSFIDESGKNVTLSSFKGKTVLMDFWASWCRPCRNENPNVVAAYKKYKDKGFMIVSISQDRDLDRWKQAIIQDGLIWNSHFADQKINNAASILYKVSYIPKTYLIDKNGIIIAKDLRGAALEEALEKALK
jgi:peroxiredoxin